MEYGDHEAVNGQLEEIRDQLDRVNDLDQVDAVAMSGQLGQIRDELHRLNDQVNATGEIFIILSKGVFWLVIFVALVSGLPGSSVERAAFKLWYSLSYDCAYKHVTVGRRPSDCNWSHAPIGDKGCYYKKEVTAFTEKERNQIMEQATSQADKLRASQLESSVVVSWRKETDE